MTNLKGGPVKMSGYKLCFLHKLLIPFIPVTSDYQDDHEEKTLPVPDLQCWVEGGVVLHRFYQMPMGSSFCLMEAYAMGANTKWSTLSEDIIRRIYHILIGNGISQYIRLFGGHLLITQ